MSFSDVRGCPSRAFQGGFAFVYIRDRSLSVVGVPVRILVSADVGGWAERGTAVRAGSADD